MHRLHFKNKRTKVCKEKMTTFTTEDRIIAEKDGSLTVNVNAGEVTLVNKDLTDDEIHDLIINKVTDADMIRQALRKAQKK
jgi:hypothetical protein